MTNKTANATDLFRHMNVREAAAMLGVSISWLNRKRLDGGGPIFIKLGRRVVYEPSDLIAFASSRKRQSTSETG